MDKVVINNTMIDDNTVKKLLRKTKEFYSNPENVKKFKEWHLKEYGCLPKDEK